MSHRTPPPDNPFFAGDSAEDHRPKRGKISTDPSIENEPHLAQQLFEVDPSELGADARIASDADLSDADRVEHSVWDEPALAGQLAGEAPAGQLTYGRWLTQQIDWTSTAQSWRTVLLIILAAGPWGVIGALWTQFTTGGLAFSGVMAAVILAPVTEEIMKVAAALWVVEKRPFRFKSGGQILLCAAASGFAFAAIENVTSLAGYNPGGGTGYAAWRWTVCTALHVTCSTAAGVGLCQIHRTAIENLRRPELALGMPWFAGAMVLHGLYNAAVTLAEASGLLEF